MSNWDDDVHTAIKRSKYNDKGAIAAREGILGLEQSQTGKKADRCYQAAAASRLAYQRTRERRKHQPLAPGTTGNKRWDAELQIVATVAA